MGKNKENQEILLLVNRFQAFIQEGTPGFFSTEELEDLFWHYFSSLDLDWALEVVQYGLQTYPYHGFFLIRKAQISLADTQWEECLNLLEQAEVLEPNNHEVFLLRGTAYDLQGKTREALKAFRKAEEMAHEDKMQVHAALGHFYQNREKYATALHYYKSALPLAEENPEILYELGFSYFQLGEDEEGFKVFQQYCDDYPFNDAGWYNLGTICNRLNRFEKAKEAFEFALALDEQNITFEFSLGNTLLNLNQPGDALAHFLEAFRQEDGNAMFATSIAVCHEKLNELDVSLYWYRKAAELDPHLPDPQLGIGYCYLLKNELEPAHQYLSKAVGMEPTNADFRYHLAETLARMNREEEAIEQYRASLNLDPEFVEARVELGNLLTDMGYEQEGIQLFRDGKKIHFDDPYFMYRFSGFLLEHGLNEEGLNNLQESLHNNLNDLSIFEEYHGDLLLIPSVKAIIDQFRC